MAKIQICTNQYKSVFTTPKSTLTLNTEKHITNPLLDIVMNPKDKVDALTTISTWSTCGPDEITPGFLRYQDRNNARYYSKRYLKHFRLGLMISVELTVQILCVRDL